jgi:hypothetical protein
MKSMKRLGILFLAIAALSLGACDIVGIRGNGHVVTDVRAIGEFDEIDASGGLRVEWQSGPPALRITTDENLLPYIDNRISGRILTIRNRTHKSLRPTHHINVVISSARLNGADLSGAVDLAAHGLSGSKFYIRASGASDVTLDGNVEEFLADLTGASDLRAQGLQTKTVDMSTTGAASAKISVSETLRVDITGAGDVTYYGNPKTIEKHVTGAGSIHHKD